MIWESAGLNVVRVCRLSRSKEKKKKKKNPPPRARERERERNLRLFVCHRFVTLALFLPFFNYVTTDLPPPLPVVRYHTPLPPLWARPPPPFTMPTTHPPLHPATCSPPLCLLKNLPPFF